MRVTLMMIAVGAILFGVSARADEATALFERAQARFLSGRAVASNDVRRREYELAAADLRQFLESFPNHANAADARYSLGTIYQQLASEPNDLATGRRALEYYRAFVLQTPGHRMASEALLSSAQLCANLLKDSVCYEEAAARIRSDYPQADLLERLRTVSVPASAPPVVENKNLTLERSETELIVRIPAKGVNSFTSALLASDSAKGLPPRFFLDVAGLNMTSTSWPTFEAGDPVAALRIGRREADVSRVVFDLRAGVESSRIQSAKEDEQIVVRFPTPATAVSATVPSVVPKQGRPVYRVVLDAGHGGEDTGARGPRGTLEKDICLSITKKLERLFKDKNGYEIFLTRSDDRYIPLAERTRLANQYRGDLFVSIHANASRRRAATGVSTYFLDNERDEESASVAERENAELKIDPAGAPTAGENYYLEMMKASMIKNFHTAQSTDLAKYVQKDLIQELAGRYRRVDDLGVKSARFFVLNGTNMPAVLVETSFISNPEEERRLRDSSYQNSIVKAVARGIDRFLRSSVGRGDHAALFK